MDSTAFRMAPAEQHEAQALHLCLSAEEAFEGAAALADKESCCSDCTVGTNCS